MVGRRDMVGVRGENEWELYCWTGLEGETPAFSNSFIWASSLDNCRPRMSTSFSRSTSCYITKLTKSKKLMNTSRGVEAFPYCGVSIYA